MDTMGKPRGAPKGPVQEKQRGMHQLILQEQVTPPVTEAGADTGVKILRQASSVGFPRQGNDVHLIARLPHCRKQHPVVQESAGVMIEVAVDDEAHPHGVDQGRGDASGCS